MSKRPAGPDNCFPHGLRVLVVEDELLIALDIDGMLEGAGLVRSASRVADALKIISKEKINVAVLDLRLGRESARPIAEKLRALGIPFVFLTGAPDSEDIRGFPEAPVISKPFDRATLLAALAKALKR